VVPEITNGAIGAVQGLMTFSVAANWTGVATTPGPDAEALPTSTGATSSAWTA
jgi:hypothetical protein